MRPKNAARTTNIRNDLGDDDTSESEIDDSLTVDESNFETPDQDGDATDYGLEYTHCNNSLNSREPQKKSKKSKKPISSTSTNPPPSEDQNAIIEHNSTKEQEQPVVSMKGNKPRKQQQKPQKTITEQSKEKKQRKEKTPQSRENRFMREVIRLQASTETLVPRLPFSRLVREILMDCGTNNDWKITREALEALQLTSELYLTQRLQDAYMLTLHRGRVTLTARDIGLINYLRTASSN